MTVDVVRSGRELTLTITFDEKPHEEEVTAETVPQEDASMPSEGNYEDWYDYFRRFFG